MDNRLHVRGSEARQRVLELGGGGGRHSSDPGQVGLLAKQYSSAYTHVHRHGINGLQTETVTKVGTIKGKSH